MGSVNLVFCERTGRWAVAWRGAWFRNAVAGSGQPLHVVETRSTAECREVLAGLPGAFLMIELAASSVDAALELLFDVAMSFRTTAAALADEPLASYEWLARELGAVHFAASPRQLAPLVGIVRRHAARNVQPALQTGSREEIWSRLPWSE
jgi:hypothetical protein